MTIPSIEAIRTRIEKIAYGTRKLANTPSHRLRQYIDARLEQIETRDECIAELGRVIDIEAERLADVRKRNAAAEEEMQAAGRRTGIAPTQGARDSRGDYIYAADRNYEKAWAGQKTKELFGHEGGIRASDGQRAWPSVQREVKWRLEILREFLPRLFLIHDEPAELKTLRADYGRAQGDAARAYDKERESRMAAHLYGDGAANYAPIAEQYRSASAKLSELSRAFLKFGVTPARHPAWGLGAREDALQVKRSAWQRDAARLKAAALPANSQGIVTEDGSVVVMGGR
jgi:hypothetical protein